MTSDAYPTADAQTLVARATWLRTLRNWFDADGFVEVETPLLSHDTVIDQHLEPLPVAIPWLRDAEGQPLEMFLQTSPEFGMKRLLLSGLTSIFQITRAFRQDESGPLHNPEFTMAEWYCAADGYREGIERLGRLAVELLGVEGWQAKPYREAFRETLGLDPWLDELRRLREVGRQRLPDLAASFEEADRDQWLEVLFSECVQPKLPAKLGVIIHDYPATQAALAQTTSRDYGKVAERFELFVGGIELANGYHELLDPDELLRRNEATDSLRQELGRRSLPQQSRLLEAMRVGLPACTGVALGVDRAIQVALGKLRLDEVIAFPFPRA